MGFISNYIAVGSTAGGDSDDGKAGVVVSISGSTYTFNESAARKLADDILRNANYLWPLEEENGTV